MAISIKDLLDSLPENSDFSNLPDWCNQLYKYYEENERHSYSEITEYIFQKKGGIEYVRKMLPLLKDIQTQVEESEVKVKLGKLIDHISLELIRYDQLLQIVLSTVEDKYAEMMNSSIEGFENVLSTASTQLDETQSILEQQKEQMNVVEKSVKQTESNAKQAEDKVKALQTENVAILGIFASIVFAFTGLMTFTNSVLENIGGASAYRVLIVCLFIGLVFLNVIGVLVNGIKRIVYWKSFHEDGKEYCATFISWFRENTLWLVGDIILVALMGFTVYGWKNSSEKKTQDISREVYIQELQNNLENSISGNDIEEIDEE